VTSPTEAVAATSTLLHGAGIVSAPAEARLLVSHVLGVDPSQMALVEALTAAQEQELRQLADRRRSGIPLQYVVGRAYFRTTSVRVGPGVFIPRPETEVLAGWAIGEVGQGRAAVVELCAGSGAISRAIAVEAAPAAQWAVEISARAFAYLAQNLADVPVTAVQADMADCLSGLNGRIDLVVANPPYLPESQRESLPPDVYFDPCEALFAAGDGLDAVRVVARTAMRLLKPGGAVGCEHGDDQAASARQVFGEAGFTDVRDWTDLAGRPRFVTARKPSVE